MIEALRNLCRDRDGVLDEQLLKGRFDDDLSSYAGQRKDGLLQRPASGPGAFQLRSVARIRNESGDLQLWRDSAGDVLLRVEDTNKLGGASVFGPSGSFDGVDLDAERSHLNITMDIRIDTDSCQPTLEHLDVDYALFEKPDERGDGPVR